MHGAGGVGCDYCDLDHQRTAMVFLERPLAYYVGGRTQEVLPGSGVVLPKRHVPSPFGLTDDEVLDVFSLVREASGLLEPGGWNLGWNVGPVAGQEVEHVHLHVIPRYAGGPFDGHGIRWLLKGGDAAPDAP